MLTAIDLDDNFGPMTGEVGVIRADRCLTRKWRSLDGGCCKEFFSASVASRRSARARGTRWSTARCALCGVHPPPPPRHPPSPKGFGGRGERSRSVLAEMLNSTFTFLTSPRRLQYESRLRRRLWRVRARAGCSSAAPSPRSRHARPEG